MRKRKKPKKNNFTKRLGRVKSTFSLSFYLLIYEMLGDEEIWGIVILVIIIGGFFGLIGLSVAWDAYKQKQETRLSNLKSTFGQELKELTKKEAKELIEKCSENPERDLPLLNRGTHYFIYGHSHEGWLEVSANIDNRSLIIAREFNVKEELKNPNLNISSRLLIFNEYGKQTNPTKRNYIMRHVWAVGSLEDYKKLLVSIYEREDFKRFYERYEYYMKEVWNLSDDFLRQAEVQQALSDTPIAYVTTIRGTNITEKCERRKMSFKLYEALDGYQVVTKIQGIAH